MRYAFRLTDEDYDYDVLTAVTAYLDCEHYAWLHSRNYAHYAILEDGPTTSRVIQHSKYFGIVFKQCHFREYIPPSEFRMTSDKPFPIHTHTMFTPTPDGGTHRSVDVTIDLPWFLWPFRRLVAAHLRIYDRRVYAEDAAAAKRRERYFGKNNWTWAFRPGQFILHKDAVVEAFGDQIRAACTTHHLTGGSPTGADPRVRNGTLGPSATPQGLAPGRRTPRNS